MCAHAARDRASAGDRWLAPVVIALLASPCLFLAYLPMTDMPQHAAIAAILEHLGDPAWGFDRWYEPALDRTLYLLPYAFTIATGQLLTTEIAVRVFVFLSAIAYPLGSYSLLRVTGRPGSLALLTLPLMYDRTFFWGFANFNLGLGMALFAIALLERDDRTRRSEIGLFALCCAIVVTHLYAVVILLGYAAIRLVVADRQRFLRRLPALAPLAVGAGVWFAMGRGVEGRGVFYFEPFLRRVLRFEDSVIGGYPNHSDEILFVAMVAAMFVFAARGIPWSRARWATARRYEKIFSVYAALNLVLYFALPTHLPSGHFIHFRHALLAVAFLPMLARPLSGARAGQTTRWLLAGLTALTFAIHVSHLVRFDREARPFDRLIAKLPDAPRVYFLSWDLEGWVTETHAYHHFHAYIQARRGGLIAFGFAELFWNIPVRVRSDAGVPVPPEDAEWHARLYDYESFGYFYDYVVVRTGKRGRGVETLAYFPYELIHSDPPWELYRHRDLAPAH